MTGASGVRRRVLHLAYEDPEAPQRGGGSLRTYEINRRLSAEFDIHQVFAAFDGSSAVAMAPGVAGRQHLGPRGAGRFAAQLGYFARLPGYVRRHSVHYDLVVEDFGAPFGSVGVPRWSSSPTLGIVQWLFADAKSREYHLPFRPVEDFGVRSHRRFIAVSGGMADELRRRNPGARVDVVANGLPADALAGDCGSRDARRDILFLGRLDVDHKGLDLLVDAYARIAADIPQNLVVAGAGDGEAWLRREIERRGLGSRVQLIGRVPTDDRFDLLRRVDAVAMPSRYESFGMVAAEAAAVGTPVLAFDISCLRDLVPDDLRVPPLDVAAYAECLRRLCLRVDWRRTLERELPNTVSHLSWDTLARQQAEVYLRAMGEHA